MSLILTDVICPCVVTVNICYSLNWSRTVSATAAWGVSLVGGPLPACRVARQPDEFFYMRRRQASAAPGHAVADMAALR